MSLKKGDFIFVDYTGRVKETGDVFDTTVEEAAKNAGIFKSGDIYRPRLIVVGEGWMLKAVDERLTQLDAGKTDTIEVPPDKAFGHRDSEKVKMVPVRRLRAKGITPRLGMQLEVNGKSAVVRTIGSGRVQLDFNPPLADKTLVYEIKVLEKLKTRIKKIKALINRRITSVDIEKFELKTKGKQAEIKVPEDAFYIEGLQIAKRGIFLDIQKFFPKITTVNFVEVFEKKESDAKQP
jgi:peptidylprolyl isomerase